jgi:hypothetical protein
LLLLTTALRFIDPWSIYVYGVFSFGPLLLLVGQRRLAMKCTHRIEPSVSFGRAMIFASVGAQSVVLALVVNSITLTPRPVDFLLMCRAVTTLLSLLSLGLLRFLSCSFISVDGLIPLARIRVGTL